MALSAKKTLLAVYNYEGEVHVLDAQLNELKNTVPTEILGAKSLHWCGNDCLALVSERNLVLVGPNDRTVIRGLADEMFCLTEVDGLRVVTPEKTYFVDIVHSSLRKIFEENSSAKMLHLALAARLKINRDA